MATDGRLSWLDRRLHVALGVEKALSGKERHELEPLYRFFQRVDVRCVFFWKNEENEKIELDTLPKTTSSPQRLLIVRKRYDVADITSTRSMDGVVVLSVALGNAWQELELVAHDVYLSLLKSAAQLENAPQEVKKALDAYYKLLASLQITKGHMEGFVALPIPLDVDALDKPDNAGRSGRMSIYPRTLPKERIHFFEGVLLNWIKIIRSAVKFDAKEQLNEIQFPGPLDLLNILRNRAASLNGILVQLSTKPQIRIVLNLLTEHESSYCAGFAASETELREAAHQATENLL